ncbi:MAG TPA: hypothetical protein VIH93_07130 [Thermoanaerobaculia bacterium]|jgi:hypothetical protein
MRRQGRARSTPAIASALAALAAMAAIGALASLTACWLVHPAHILRPLPPPAEKVSAIVGYRIRHNAPDHLALEVEYVYAGEQGPDVFLGGTTWLHGESTGHWSYRPDPAVPGHHWARVLIGINPSAPSSYRSDEVELSMYVGGKSEFVHQRFRLVKTWRKIPGGPRCHRNWGQGCDG